MITLKVSPDGLPAYSVEVVPRDILNWERTGTGRSMAGLVTNMRMTDLYDLAYFAAKRLGLFAGTPGEMQSTCDVEIDGEAPEPDPTHPAA